MKRFKEQERAEKEARKKAKKEAARQEALERERVKKCSSIFFIMVVIGTISLSGAAA